MLAIARPASVFLLPLIHWDFTGIATYPIGFPPMLPGSLQSLGLPGHGVCDINFRDCGVRKKLCLEV